jgi:hypothetical protein
MARRKRRDKPFNVSDFLNPASEGLETAIDTLLHTPPEQTIEPVENPAPAEDSTANTIRIAGLRTVSQTGTQSQFRMRDDALALFIDIKIAEELIRLEIAIDANFQIVENATNLVRVDSWSRDVKPAGARCWISQGNHWGPGAHKYSTPARWGLREGLYRFRAVLEVPPLGLFSTGDVVRFFRVR